MIVNNEKMVAEFHFSPFRWGWADVVMSSRGYHGHTMQSVMEHYGFSEVLSVQGLTYCLVNNGRWQLKFREVNSQLIIAYISPGPEGVKSVRQFAKSPTPTPQDFPL